MNRSTKVFSILVFCFLMVTGSVLALGQPAPPMKPVVSMAATPAPAPVMKPVPLPMSAPKPRLLVMAVAPTPVPAMAVAPVVAVPKPAVAPAAVPVAAPPATVQPTTATTPTEPATTTGEKKDSKGRVFGGWALEILLYLLGLALLAVKGVLVKWLWEKYKLDKYVSADKVDEMVGKGVDVGIGYAEEQSHKLHDDPIDGAKKLDLAIAKVNEYLRDSGIPEKGAAYLATLIESKLPTLRTNGQTSEPEVAKAVTEPTKEKEEKSDK